MTRFDLAVVTLFFDQHDMITVLGAEYLADLTHRRVIHRFLERIYITERSDPTQFTTGLLR